jgi:hypothetical protein
LRGLVLFAVLLGTLAPASYARGAVVQPLNGYRYALIQVERDAAPGTRALLRANGASLISPTLRIWRLPSLAARRIAPRLARSGALAVLTPDSSVRPLNHITSGDPLIPLEWWLPVIGADRVEPPGPGRPLVVIDGGIDLSHPEFAGRPNTTVLNPQTVGREQFHGTAVASVAAAPANGVGLVGAYPRADLRSWDASPGADLTAGSMLQGIDVASRACPAVVNLSVGTDRASPLLEQVVQLAVERGCVIVAASGNSRGAGSPPVFPAGLPHVLTAGSVNRGGGVSSFSTASLALDLAAPGEDIPAAVPFATFSSGYAGVDGTSFAAPLVAGATAWVWTVRGLLDDTQMFDLMRSSARDVWPPGRDSDTGLGIVDIPRALAAAIPPVDPMEPNEDVLLVKPGGLTTAGKPVLRGRQTLRARLDVTEDPRDVYRIFVPARQTLTVGVSGQRNVNLRLWRGSTTSVRETGVLRRVHLLGASSMPAAAMDSVRFRNRGRAGVFVYAEALLGPAVADDSYSLSLIFARR